MKKRAFTIINTNSVLPPSLQHILQFLWANYPNSTAFKGQGKTEKGQKAIPHLQECVHIQGRQT